MAASKDLRGVSVKKALHKAEKANKNPNAKKAVNAKKTTSLKATAVKPARFNRGVAGVAVASTLAMMLPSAAASALQINQQNIVDSANVEQAKPVKKEKSVNQAKSVKTINTLKKTKTVNAVKSVEPENTNRTVNTQKESNADSNADTTTNAINSYVITPNENNLEAKDQNAADEQVQTEQNPETTYNLRIHYIIGGDSTNHLAQSYELTIDQSKLDSLKEGNYEYIPIPKSSGYSLSAVDSSAKYQYYIQKGENNYIVDDGTDAEAQRYLRLSKDLITNYATNKKSVLVNNDVAQDSQTSQTTPSQASSQATPQNPQPQTTQPQNQQQTPQGQQSQTTQPQTPQSQNTPTTQQNANSSTQYYGELNINYTPKEVKYYVHHMLQDAKDRDKFTDYNAPNSSAITVKDENGQNTEIHVTEATGKVGTTVKAVSINIPGYEPENNIVSSPISDSADEKDKLVLNLRYYRKAYTVTYDSAGGTDVTAQKVYYNQGVPEVSEPTYRGHKFLGWQIVDSTSTTSTSAPSSGSSVPAAYTTITSTSTSSKKPEKVDFSKFTMPNHDVKLRAMWDANKTTSYRVNVWVQKADLVDDKVDENNPFANYDFVGLVERKNVKTDSNVVLDKMDDAGVVADNKTSGANENSSIDSSELGLTKEELQGKLSDHTDGLISKFNWMNDTPVTSLEGYDTNDPGAAKNKGNDLFTRYFHVNKDLTEKFNSKEHYSVPGRTDLGKRSKSKLCANDLNNTLNLFYDRKTYELIFAKPAGIKDNGLNNAAIKRKDKNGKTTIYCYAGGGECSKKYDGDIKDKNGTKIDHKGYRVKVRYGQSLTDIWPKATEVDYGDEDFSLVSLGWKLGYAGEHKYRDTPPYRFTKEEFADPEFRAVGNKYTLRISDNPSDSNSQQYELKDNQRLITSETISTTDDYGGYHDLPYTVIIKKQSIESAKKGDTGKKIKYELSTDSYAKDDTSNDDYKYTSPSIAGFKPENLNKEGKVEAEKHDIGDFYDEVHNLYEDLTGEDAPDDPPEEDDDNIPDYACSADDDDCGGGALKKLNDAIAERLKKDPVYKKYYEFKKKYHISYHSYLVGFEGKLEFDSDISKGDLGKNGIITLDYSRQSYDVQFYNADGNAISNAKDGAATDSLPYEYSLTKRGKKDLTGEDKDLYGKDTSYDDSVTKDDANDTSKKLDGKYTFTLNGIKYSIIRPDYLPKDYVFKGWALDQAGTRFINGEDKDITVPVNGIKLYAAWGLPTNIQHTVTLDYQMHEIGEDGKEGPNVIKTFMCNHNDPIHENDIKIPVRKGFDFYGWELVKKGNEVVEANTPYAFGNKVVEDITLRAVWVQDTRYNGTFKHIFLKPGVTFDDYKNAATEEAKAALVDHVSTQTVSGLREHLRYNAEAVYSDETHFPDKHFTSFEASSDETDNTGEFVYQTYNTRKYKVRYVTIGKDGKEKDLLPESEVSSVNRKYDVAFYKPIEGFMPRTTQQKVLYRIGKDGKQIGEDTFKFVYDDVRVLKRQDDAQHRPDHYTRYVFKVADNQSSMGSVVDWQGNNVADGSALVYDAIKGTKAYQMPLPTVEAKPGFEFDEWTSKIGSSAPGSTELQYSTGVNRLPIRSEEQNSPEVIYIAKFKLKAPVAAAPQVLTPLENISTESGESAKKLITNADEYPEGATFSFADGATFDSTPGLHKIKVQVKLEGNTAEAEVLYRVLPDLVYASDWDKFKTSDYGSKHEQEYAPITFTGKNDEGTIIGHDTTGTTPSTSGKTTLTAYVYKGKQVRIRVPQAFGRDHSENNYHYVFKGWTTKVVQPTPAEPKPEQKYDIDSEGRYKDVKVDDNSGKTYTAVYKRIDYFSSSSDGGEVPKDAVVAIFKPAPGRLWKDGTSGPKVFYVKKGTDISNIPYSSSDSTNALVRLKENLTNATGTWKRSSMLNDGKKLAEVKDVADVTGEWKDGWKVNESFQEFVADQKDWTEPAVQTDYLVAVQDDADSLPKLTDFITNMPELKEEAALKDGVEDIKVEYDLPTEAEKNKFKQKMLKKPALYTVPLKVTIKYNDAADYKTYKLVGRLKVLYKLMYPDSLPKENTQGTDQTGANAERKLVFDKTKYVEVKFINAKSDTESPNGKGEFAEGSRTLYYAYKDSASGVRAPQVIGKDYDAKGYHYEFQGWEIQEDTTFVTNTATSVPVMTLFAAMTPSTTTVPNPQKVKLYSSAEIASRKFARNTNIVPHYKLVKNVIDASQQDEIPDGYVATIFLPGFGRTWADGSYKPKLLYIRHGKDKEDNIKFAQKVASDTAAKLSGFTKWQMYNARGDKSNILLHDNWDISKPRIFVAEQNGVDDVKIPETVIGVGESIPNVNKLVHNTDPKVSVSVDSSSTVDVSKPGISTIMVNVTKPTDEIDTATKKHKTVTTKLPVRVYVLPKVIADNDLPAEGTAAAKFVEKNYTKVTYVAGEGGEMKSPVFTYWVRKGAKDLHMPVPDVLAANGYVFKNWTSITTETPVAPADRRKATAEEREALARLAKIDGMHDVAKQISDSRKFTFAALQNLLNEARKSRAKQEAYNVYNAKREELAQVAERKGNTDLAQQIRDSHDSLQDIKYKLAETGIDVDEVIEQLHEKALLVKLAKEAGKEWLAKQISNSKRSSIESLKNLMREAGIDLTFANYEETNKSNVSDEQRELLAEIADDANKPFVAKIIRSSKKSSLEVLKQVLRNAGVDLYAVPASEPKKEITVTANFELMKPMRFEFRSSAISGIPATFTLANLTENSSGNTTVSVDGVNSPINALTPNSPGSNGLLPSCTGTTCKISGTPKIVDGKPKVEVKFTTVDQYGRRAEIVVYIDVVDSAKPDPTPDTTPVPEPDYSTGPSDYVVPAYEPAPVPAPVPVVPLQDKQKTGVKGDLLPQTGVDASQSALIASLLASVGFAGFAAKHRRKREDGKNN